MDQRTRRLGSQLCKAVNDGDPRLVQLLLAQGACPDLVGSKGAAAIHLAVGKETEKNTRCLKILLQFGANPNIRSSEGLTPVHIAALWGCFQNLKTLLMNGGDANVKDSEGNIPRQLAEEQGNRKCALLLQEYEASSADTEQDGFPLFQYSVYSDQSDTSSYPASDYSFSSRSSIISDFGDAVLSSTRRSSLFNFSHLNDGLHCSTRIPPSRYSDVHTTREDWNNSFAHWAAEAPNLLSSTRMSSLEHAAPMPVLKEDDLFTHKDVCTVQNTEQASPSRRETLPALSSRRVSRKSVSFRDVDEFFPVFSPQSPQKPNTDGSQFNSNLSFDLTEYSDFLDSERMATVLNKQGLDVTSPDHAYVFCRDGSTSTDEDMDKTVISHFASEESDNEQMEEALKDTEVSAPEQPAPLCKGSSSSGTSGSHYSSCDSDHYTSALDVSTHPRCEPSSEEKETFGDTQNCTFKPRGSRTECHDGDLLQDRTQTDSAAKTLEQVFNEIKLEEKNQTKTLEAPVDHSVTQSTDTVSSSFTTPRSNAAAVEGPDEISDLPFTPSPFVTGRTRSRLSRCSLRASRTPESLFTSSLFEETIPLPVRSRRGTPRSESSEEYYRSPHVPYDVSVYSGDDTAAQSLAGDCQDRSSTVRPDSYDTQSDTIILPKSQTDPAPESETLSDTFILEKKQVSTLEAYERTLAEIALAIKEEKRNPSEGEFFTDDLTSTDEAAAKVDLTTNHVRDEGAEDAWITEDRGSQTPSVSSSSSSSYFSPRRSREDSDPVSTPGTGCTPRYSMSRLSGWRRSNLLSNLSFTSGGRPLIQDLDEPVEYLYTDTERGHKLIETHVPPTANTSLSSSMDSSSSEETLLYDWRSMQADLLNNKGKENQEPQQATQDGQSIDREDSLLEKTKGMTDRELRLRLVEFGESPGPISRHTRPTYMRRLHRLLQESRNSPSTSEQKKRDQPQPQTAQTVHSGYSPELSQVLQTFQLPNSQADEQELSLQFDQPDQNRKWREGIIKSSFNYLLLDPRVTKNLPFRSHTLTPHECFQTFVNAIFYVGKGKRSRPYSHLYEALEYYREEKTAKKLCPKVQHILQVWTAGQGVISLHCFQNVIPVEAYTREACMVEAIGLKMLTNQKRGDFYGVVSNWQSKRKRELGVHLLYRAMQIFLAEGERQLRPADIRQ